jgi:hypothetical protein
LTFKEEGQGMSLSSLSLALALHLCLSVPRERRAAGEMASLFATAHR